MFPLSRFEISGTSMIPTFAPGDRVLVWRWGSVREGDTIVFCKNGMKMVKRLAQKTGDRWTVRGDNINESTDSLDFGAIEKKQIIGKIITRY